MSHDKCGTTSQLFLKIHDELTSAIEKRIDMAKEKLNFEEALIELRNNTHFNDSWIQSHIEGTKLIPVIKFNLTRVHFCFTDICNNVNTEHHIFDLCGSGALNKAQLIPLLVLSILMMIP